jgi:hypothetical protein
LPDSTASCSRAWASPLARIQARSGRASAPSEKAKCRSQRRAAWPSLVLPSAPARCS